MNLIEGEILQPNTLSGLTVTNYRIRYVNEKYMFSTLLLDISTVQAKYSQKKIFLILAGLATLFLAYLTQIRIDEIFYFINGFVIIGFVGAFFFSKKHIIEVMAKDGQSFTISIQGKNQSFAENLAHIIEKKKVEAYKSDFDLWGD